MSDYQASSLHCAFKTNYFTFLSALLKTNHLLTPNVLELMDDKS